MKRSVNLKSILFICTFISILFMSACSDDGTNPGTTEASESNREVISTLPHTPLASGVNTHVSEVVSIDYSNSAEGYIMVKYLGSHTDKVKLQLTGPDSRKYTYNLEVGKDYEVFPLTGGSGVYAMHVFEQSSGNKYRTADSKEIEVQIKDEFTTYLYPNQFVNYYEGSAAIKSSREVASTSTTDINYIQNVYEEVMELITYDEEQAELALSGQLAGYIPNLENVMSTGNGICFDYASLMVAMLRSQNIPSKLVIGYTGEIYHAWINVYVEESGWIDGAIEFNGQDWSLLDPTFADNTKNRDDINDYIGDGNNYTEKYIY